MKPQQMQILAVLNNIGACRVEGVFGVSAGYVGEKDMLPGARIGAMGTSVAYFRRFRGEFAARICGDSSRQYGRLRGEGYS